MQLVYTKKYRVNPSDVDFRKRLKLSALFDFFQDIADLAAGSLGFGIDALAQNFGVGWVLTRIRVELTRIPDLHEELTIETWPSQHSRLSFERDFVVMDANGAVIAAAVSAWVLLDMASRELKRADFIGFDLPLPVRERALTVGPGKIKPDWDCTPIYQKTIGYSDIDFNGHINNARYVDYALDCFDIATHTGCRVRSAELNYLTEALPEDILHFSKGTCPANGAYYVEGTSVNSGKTVFRALVAMDSARD